MDLEQISKNAIDLVLDVGRYIQNERKSFSIEQVEVKGKNDFVSHVDKTAEEILVTGLKKILPEAGFITEEETESSGGEDLVWIIDPLDGTTNFIHGLPPYAISVALYNNNKPLIGIVYEVCLNECFYSWDGEKAFLNGKPIEVSKVKKLSGSLIITGFPYKFFDVLPKIMESISYFMKNSHGLRRLGSAATDLAYVACGRSEGFYEHGLNAWDTAAGAFLVQQAGGRVADFSGGDNFLFGKEIVASNSYMFDEFHRVLKKIFK